MPARLRTPTPGPRRPIEADWKGNAPAVRTVVDWWSANARALPWRSSRDDYAIWVSEVMSAQTTIRRAAEAWARWMERWPTVEQLAEASLADVLGEWQGLGYPRRARDLHRAARVVAQSGWPQELTELPGVGPYVASAIRCFAREEAVLPLDVNVQRVLRRRFRGGVDISADPWPTAQALMEFGQRICSARPRCELCPISDGCGGPEDAGVAAAPRRQPRFEGSLRQRRGTLLRQVLAEGRVRASGADPDAASGLVSDGLVGLCGSWLVPPT